MHPEQRALVVQHPEAVALVKGNTPPAQVIFGWVLRVGLLRLAEHLAVALHEQFQNFRTQPAVSQAPEHAEILQQRPLPVLREPYQRVAHGFAVLRHQQGVVPPHVHQPEHGRQRLQLRVGEVHRHLVLIEGGQFLFIQQS